MLQGQPRKGEEAMHSRQWWFSRSCAGCSWRAGVNRPPPGKLLSAPTGVIALTVQHNEEDILAYSQRQWVQARQQFEAAITAAPSLAEAHYNLGVTLCKLGTLKEGDRNFIEAANLAPAHTVIWSSPPLRNVQVPDKITTTPDDGHGHDY